jgi:hypothetical protein
MHVATGGTLKGTWFGELASCPREGTRRRELYDLFKANEGIPIRAKLTTTGVITLLSLLSGTLTDLTSACCGAGRDQLGF